MPEKSFETTQEDHRLAKDKIIKWAKSFGVDVSGQAFLDFVDHQAKVLACERAENRFLQNIIHKQTFGEDYGN